MKQMKKPGRWDCEIITDGEVHENIEKVLERIRFLIKTK